VRGKNALRNPFIHAGTAFSTFGLAHLFVIGPGNLFGIACLSVGIVLYLVSGFFRSEKSDQ